MWRSVGSTHDVRESSGLVLLKNGRVLVAGGHRDPQWKLIGTAELYDPSSETWSPTGDLVEPREGIGALTLLANGKVLLAGEHMTRTGAELYEPATGKWSATGSLHTGRGGHSTTLLQDGRVLVAGGIDYDAPGTPIFASAEIYDPATESWTETGAMLQKRFKHGAARLPNGQVLVAGGTATEPSANRPHASAEIYDPATGNWTETGSLTTARETSSIVVLRDGRVLLAGGAVGSFGNYTSLADVEIYDPQTATWTPTAPMKQDRVGASLTLLPDGRVLAAGGATRPRNAALSIAEIYDPATRTWSDAGIMNAKRWNHRAVLLPNGSVLIVGGFNITGQLRFAEVFTPR